MVNHIKLTLLVALFISPLTAVSVFAGDTILPFSATYSAKFKGLPIKATGVRELSRTEAGNYLFTSTASSFVASVSENSLFTVQEGRLQPQLYQYNRRGIGKNKTEEMRFEWQEALIHYENETSPIEPEVLDKLVYQLQLRSDARRKFAHGYTQTDAPALFTYQIADEEKRKTYRFTTVSEEVIATPIGMMRSLRLDRVREDGRDRQTSLWLAIDHDFLLVKLVQTEEDSGFELNLTGARINGIDIGEQ